MVDCLVEFEYSSHEEDELCIKPGEIINDVKKMDGGWWEGSLNGRRGMFPDNFVKEIAKKDKPKETVLAPAPAGKKSAASPPQQQQTGHVAHLAKNLSGMKMGPGSAQAKVESAAPVIAEKRKTYAKVTFQYIPQHEDELGLELNEVIEVTKQEEEGWWEGSKGAKTGMFPSNFVDIITDELSSEELEKADKEKPIVVTDGEASFHEIKGKKVKGVGLGDIFGGQPIKLRSTSRDEVEQPISEPRNMARSEPKGKKSIPPQPIGKDAPILPPKEVKEARPTGDLYQDEGSISQVSPTKHKSVLFFNMTGDSMMVYDVDSFTSPERSYSPTNYTTEDYTTPSTQISESTQSSVSGSEYGTPEVCYVDLSQSYLYVSDEDDTMEFSKVWNETEEIPLELSNLSQARQTPPPKQSFLRRRKSRGMKDSPNSTQNKSAESVKDSMSAGDALIPHMEEIKTPSKLVPCDSSLMSQFLHRKGLDDDLCIDALCIDGALLCSTPADKYKMLAAGDHEFNASKVIDSVKLTKHRLSLPDMPGQVTHVGMVLKDDAAYTDAAMRRGEQINTRPAASCSRLPVHSAGPPEIPGKSSTLPAGSSVTGLSGHHARPSKMGRLAFHKPLFHKPVTKHLSMLRPNVLLKKLSLMRHPKPKKNKLTVAEQENYLHYLFVKGKLSRRLIYLMEKYQIYPEGKMNQPDFSLYYKSYLTEHLEAPDGVKQSVGPLKPSRVKMPKRTQSELKPHGLKVKFKIKRTATVMYTGPTTEDESKLSVPVTYTEPPMSYIEEETKPSTSGMTTKMKRRSLSGLFWHPRSPEVSGKKTRRRKSDLFKTKKDKSPDASSEKMTKRRSGLFRRKDDSESPEKAEKTSRRRSGLFKKKEFTDSLETDISEKTTRSRSGLFRGKEDSDPSDKAEKVTRRKSFGLFMTKDASPESKKEEMPKRRSSLFRRAKADESSSGTEAAKKEKEPTKERSSIMKLFSFKKQKEQTKQPVDSNATSSSTVSDDLEAMQVLSVEDISTRCMKGDSDNSTAASPTDSEQLHVDDYIRLPEDLSISGFDVAFQTFLTKMKKDDEFFASAGMPSYSQESSLRVSVAGEEAKPGNNTSTNSTMQCSIVSNTKESPHRLEYNYGRTPPTKHTPLDGLKLTPPATFTPSPPRDFFRLSPSSARFTNHSTNSHEENNTNQSANPESDCEEGFLSPQYLMPTPPRDDDANPMIDSLLPDSSYSTIYKYHNLSEGSANDSKDVPCAVRPTTFHTIYKSHSQSSSPANRAHIPEDTSSSMETFPDRLYEDEDLPLLYSQSLPLSTSQRWATSITDHTRCPINPIIERDPNLSSRSGDLQVESDIEVQDISTTSLNQSTQLPQRDGDIFNHSQDHSINLADTSLNLLDDVSRLLPGLHSYSESGRYELHTYQQHPQQGYDVAGNDCDEDYDLPEQGYDEVPVSYDEVSERLGTDEVCERIQGCDEVSERCHDYDEVDLESPYLEEQSANIEAAIEEPSLEDECFPMDLSSDNSPNLGPLLTSTAQNAQDLYYTLGGLSPGHSPQVNSDSGTHD